MGLDRTFEHSFRPIPQNSYPKIKRTFGIGSRLLVHYLCNYFSEATLRGYLEILMQIIELFLNKFYPYLSVKSVSHFY